MNENVNIEQWKLGSRNIIIPAKSLVTTPASKKFKRFICAPLPYDWITIAAKLPGKSLHVAMVIRYLVGVSKQKTVKLSHKPAAEFGVGVKALYNALSSLESAGLIMVERHVGRSPRITVLNGQGSVEEIGAMG